MKSILFIFLFSTSQLGLKTEFLCFMFFFSKYNLQNKMKRKQNHKFLFFILLIENRKFKKVHLRRNSKIIMLRRTRFIVPTFNKNTPNKIGNLIQISGKNTLINTDDGFRVAIADESIDANVDGRHLFCARVENAGIFSDVEFGFTPMETFDSTKSANFGESGFTGAGMFLNGGSLYYPVDKWHNIINYKISERAKEIISILTISNKGKKKEIRFLCDGNETKSSDVSEHLKGDLLFPAISLCYRDQQITTIPIDQIKTRTAEIGELIKEYQEQQSEALTPVRPIAVVPSIASEPNNADQIISQLRQRIDVECQKQVGNLEEQLKQTRMQMEKKDSQIEDMRKDFLKQLSDSQKNLLQHFESECQILRTQLDLERAEHQKTRNLLSLKK
jgi:hypothetical protein